MKISIIIPFFNRWNLTHIRLMEIYQRIKEPVEVVLVDDASTEEDCRQGTVWWQENGLLSSVKYFKNEKNLGFIGSMNNGAKVAIQGGAELLVFLSNDVEIKKDFVPEMLAHLKNNSRILMGGKIIDFDSGWNGITYKEKKVVVAYLEGWLLACTPAVWNELGGFDPIYQSSDFEDVCLSTTAQYLKIPMIPLHPSYFRHLAAQSYGYTPERRERTERNRKLWIEKWSGKWDEFWK